MSCLNGYLLSSITPTSLHDHTHFLEKPHLLPGLTTFSVLATALYGNVLWCHFGSCSRFKGHTNIRTSSDIRTDAHASNDIRTDDICMYYNQTISICIPLKVSRLLHSLTNKNNTKTNSQILTNQYKVI